MHQWIVSELHQEHHQSAALEAAWHLLTGSAGSSGCAAFSLRLLVSCQTCAGLRVSAFAELCSSVGCQGDDDEALHVSASADCQSTESEDPTYSTFSVAAAGNTVLPCISFSGGFWLFVHQDGTEYCTAIVLHGRTAPLGPPFVMASKAQTTRAFQALAAEDWNGVLVHLLSLHLNLRLFPRVPSQPCGKFMISICSCEAVFAHGRGLQELLTSQPSF